MSWNELPPDIRQIAETELTRKQLDVLKLWINGHGTARIALIADISESTARGHLRRAQQIMAKALEATE